MNILSLTNCPLDPKSGSGKTVLAYTRGLEAGGHSVDVLEPKDYEIGTVLRRGKKFRQAAGAWKAVNKRLQEKRYDLIEFYGDEFWLAIWLLSKSSDRPLLVSHTNGLELLDRARAQFYDTSLAGLRKRFTARIHLNLSQLAFARADAFVSLCELDRQYVLDLKLYSSILTQVIEPGLDDVYLSLPFRPLKEDRVAFNGSWIPRKGVKVLASVMSAVLRRHPEVRFDVYGTGDASSTVLRSFPSDLHSRIIVYPRMTDSELANSLARAKVFFFPSQYEGFGIALAEAMACGCATVTTPTGFGGALRDNVDAQIRGFDDVQGMESAILSLLQDDELRTRIASTGWRRVRNLTWQSNVKKLEAIYTEWLWLHQSRSFELMTSPHQVSGT